MIDVNGTERMLSARAGLKKSIAEIDAVIKGLING